MKRLAMLWCALAAGCGTQAPPASTTRETSEPAHSHEREKMLLADLGKNHHAGLTAHLSSKTGNELDVFIESAAEDHAPAPLPVAKLIAEATTADGKPHELIFEPSEPVERKGDPPGKCSHFTARAPWMKPDDVLTVSMKIPLEGKTHTVTWNNFNPKKYAHFEE